jgi:hypothetical protein
MSEKVKIDKIKPENSPGDDLKHYYFQQDPDGINFYSPLGAGPLNHEGPIIIGTPFTATLDDGSTFTVNVTGMTGTWLPATVGDPGDGTFQAQAGGAGEEEPTSSASAYA